MGRAKQPQKTHIITRALTNENIHENMQFERNEKHLILITTNYIEPPKYNYAVEALWRLVLRGEGLKIILSEAKEEKVFVGEKM